MNIDERLEKLAERHQALAESCEIMQSEGIRLQKLVETHERRFEWMREDTQGLKELLASVIGEVERRELRTEAKRRGAALDERIDKLVTAIGRMIPKEGGAA